MLSVSVLYDSFRQMVGELRRIIICFLFVAVTTASTLAEEVKIGVIVPLSSDMAVHGLEVQRAMQLALDDRGMKELNHRYTLIFEDNQLVGARSVSAAQKLINQDRVDVVVTLWPPTASVVAPLTVRSGVLHYTIAWDPELVRQHELMLNHQVMVDEIARSTLRLMAQRGIRKVAFLHMQESGFDLGATMIRSLAPSECIELVIDESFLPTESDFRSLVARTMQKRPDGILVWTVMPSIDLLIRQVRSQNVRIPIFGYLDLAENLSELQGAHYISEMFSSPEFDEKYSMRFGSPPRSKGPNAYDITNLLVDAYESSADSKLSATEVRALVTKRQGVRGAVGVFSVQSDGNSSYAPVVRVIEGTLRPLAGVELVKSNCR